MSCISVQTTPVTQGDEKRNAMDFKDLTPEQREKVRQCTSPKELLALAKKEGAKLTEEQLEMVSGGAWTDDLIEWEITCPSCFGTFTTTSEFPEFCQLCGKPMNWGSKEIK